MTTPAPAGTRRDLAAIDTLLAEVAHRYREVQVNAEDHLRDVKNDHTPHQSDIAHWTRVIERAKTAHAAALSLARIHNDLGSLNTIGQLATIAERGGAGADTANSALDAEQAASDALIAHAALMRGRKPEEAPIQRLTETDRCLVSAKKKKRFGKW